jgi:hypothetical protein
MSEKQITVMVVTALIGAIIFVLVENYSSKFGILGAVKSASATPAAG